MLLLAVQLAACSASSSRQAEEVPAPPAVADAAAGDSEGPGGASTSSEPPRGLVLSGEECNSDARPVSLEAEGAALADFLQLTGLMAGRTVRIEGDVPDVLVDATLQAVPWDCVVQELAGQLALKVQLEGEAVVLRPEE